MHWFWRATIAVTVGVFYAIYAPFNTSEVYSRFIGGPALLEIGLVVIRIAPVVLIMLTTYALVSYFLKSPRDRETRCRKCGYILRGISEPRCPECGETI